MKRKEKYITYSLSFFIPIVMFSIVAIINGFLPFSETPLNPHDALFQYPPFNLEFIRLLKSGNIFYSWSAGLGFNFFGSATYYSFSPLNIFTFLATPKNYNFFIAIMTLIRFGFLGLSMCFYLSKKNYKNSTVVLFSTIFALSGFVGTYFYNHMWIDAIILLPLVVYSLENLIEGKSGTPYTLLLGITIITNYYIGYMICIFCLLYFIYKILFIKEKKNLLKNFLIHSLLAGMIGGIVLLPSFFALLTGKAKLYGIDFNYFRLSHFGEYIYMLTSGAYSAFSYTDGPALIYTGLLTPILIVFYFFDKKVDKKEKLASFIFIAIFYLSFTVNFLNYVWQLFQKPIWWQSRFSFLFSFFLITLAAKTLDKKELPKMKTVHKLIIWLLMTVLVVVGDCLKHGDISETLSSTAFYIIFSSLLFLIYFFLIDRKKTFALLAIFTLVDLTMNSFNVLLCIKNSATFKENSTYLKTELPKVLESNREENFYRFDSTKSLTAMDGAYFGFNGIDYFNSARNMQVINLFNKLGISVQSDCYISLTDYDPLLYSLFNVKYIYGTETDYYENIGEKLYLNRFPLSIAFTGGEEIKNIKLAEDGFTNREEIIKTLSGLDLPLYKNISVKDFKTTTKGDKTIYTYEFTSDKNYFPVAVGYQTMMIDEDEYDKNSHMILNDGSHFKITFDEASMDEYSKVEVHFLDLDSFEKHMEKLSSNLMSAKTNVNGHILEGTIEVTKDDDYLFTTIEYEKGMSIYVDGAKMEPDIILGTLIGFDLKKGTHEIYIDYTPRGLRGGIALSSAGIVILIIYTKKRKKI